MRWTSAALRTFRTLLFVLACLLSAAPEAPAQGPNPEDPVQAGYLRRFSQGMPVDSLYYLLAGHALRGLAFDTAMAFNLSIPTPVAGAFRDSVLAQRYRLYVLSGLHDDAMALKDSLPRLHRAARPGRRAEWEVKTFSGYGREDQAPARVYPAGFELEGIRSEGWLARHQAGVTLPLPSPSASALSLGLGYDLAKSYYKDSLDYRAEARLKADRILDRLSAAVTAEGGRITGMGSVAALKAEATLLFLGGGGFLIVNAGYESEWEGFESRRYDATWFTVHREWGSAAGRAFHLSGSATWLRTDPLELPGSHPVIYIEDAGQEAPVHYTDGTYRDTVPSSRFTAYQVYTEAIGGLEFRCPQNALTLSPSAGLSFQAGWGMTASLSAGYAWSWYPSPYRWLEQSGGDPFAEDSSSFHAYARSRVDGRYYPAYLDKREGPLREAYGSEPLAEREATRMDQRLQAGFGLKRKLAGMGTLALDFGLQRTFPGLEGESPLWSPEWEIDAAVRWTLSGVFR